MKMHFSPATAVALLLAAGAAQAASPTLSGGMTFHNGVVQIDFSLTSAADVKIWSDSWQSGLNFDPVGAVWAKSGSDYTLIAEVDDDDTIGPGQGFFDTGFNLPALAAGSYRFTLAASFNAANGTLLSQGFAYDTQTPIPIPLWNQPSYNPNTNDQKGQFWRVNFSNVAEASLIPEPGQWLLLALGLGAFALRRNTAR